MDLQLLYSNFIMDNKELMFHITPDATHIFQDDRGFSYCAITAFQNGDPAISQDPLSTNRRLTDFREFQMFGTLVVAGPTPDEIYVLIPDSVSSTVDGVSPADLQHVVGLSLLRILVQLYRKTSFTSRYVTTGQRSHPYSGNGRV